MAFNSARYSKAVVDYWGTTIRMAIKLGNEEAAYRCTIHLVARCRELGLNVTTCKSCGAGFCEECLCGKSSAT